MAAPPDGIDAAHRSESSSVFADLLRHPGVVEDVELRSRFGFLALHGGSLERGTAEIARVVADDAGASLYSVRQPEDLRWHIPSYHYDPAESAALAQFLDHVHEVVSIHGYGRKDQWRTLLVGGTNRELAGRAARVLRDALPGYRVVDDLDEIPAALRGVHPANPVNRTRRGGIQLELPPRVRDDASHPKDRAALISALASLGAGQ